MEIFENRIPLRSREMVDRSDSLLGVLCAKAAACGKQRCRQIGNRSTDRLSKVAPRRRILLALERVDSKEQAGDAIILVGLRHALGKFHGLIDISVDQECEEDAVKQFAIVRITLECRPVIGGGSSGVALLTGMARSQVASRGADGAGLQGACLLRGKRGGCCRQKGSQRA